MDKRWIASGALGESLRQAITGSLGAWAAETRGSGLEGANNEGQFVIIQTYTVAVHVDNGTIANVNVLRTSQAYLDPRGR